MIVENAIGLAPGPYDFTFVEFEKKESVAGRDYWLATLKLTGYRGYIAWDTFVNHENAAWKWKALDVEYFHSVPLLLEGRTFLCRYKIEVWQQQERGRIMQYLAEKE